MKIINFKYNQTLDFNFEPLVLCVGSFSCIHTGHQQLIKKTQQIAQQDHFKACVLTFEPSIKAFLKKENHQIWPLWQKKEWFKKHNFAYYINYEANQLSVKVSPQQFIRLLQKKFNVKKIVVGEDFVFGFQAQGNIKDLAQAFGKDNLIVIKHHMHQEAQKTSSSTIRTLLVNHDIVSANKLMVEPFKFKGIIVEGRKLGRTINFPTINQEVTVKQPISFGVYVSQIRLNNKNYYGITDYYAREKKTLIETYLFNFKANAYGKIATISFLKYLRANVAITQLNELIPYLKKDEQEAKKFLKNKV